MAEKPPLPPVSSEQEPGTEDALDREVTKMKVEGSGPLDIDFDKLEREEQDDITRRIEAMKNEGGVAPDLASGISPPVVEAQPPEERVKSKALRDQIEASIANDKKEAKEADAIPPEIREVYGDDLPKDIKKIVKTFTSLKGQRKEQYIPYLKEQHKKAESVPVEKGPEKTPVAAEGPVEKKAVPDRWGGYPQAHTELLKLIKERYGKDIPPELSEDMQQINKDYLRERGKKEPDLGALKGYTARLQTILDRERSRPAASETEAQQKPAAEEPLVPEAMPSSEASAPVETVLSAEAEKPAPLPEVREEAVGVQLDPISRAENKEKLAYVIGRLVGRTARKGLDAGSEAAKAGKEKFDWYKSSSEALIRRSAELDAELDKMGWVGKGVRWMGERYNKLDWKAKVAVGVALGIGSVATAGLPIGYACLAGIGAQRVLGFSSMFLKFEKTSASQASAVVKAGVYGLAMSYAMKEAVQWASETEFGHWMQEHMRDWLAHKPEHHQMMPGTSYSAEAEHVMHPESVPPAVEAHVAAPQAPAPEAAAPAAVAEATTSAPAELPSVEASPGHGYEWMAKRLWEQLSEKHLDPNSFPEGSDIRTLLNADDKSIDSVVHQVAMSHGAFKDGISGIISPDAHLSLGTDGNLSMEGVHMAEPVAGTDFPNAEAELPAAAHEISSGAPTLEGTVPPAEEPPPMVDVPSGKVLIGPEFPLPDAKLPSGVVLTGPEFPLPEPSAAEAMPTIDVAPPPPVSSDIAGMPTIDVPPAEAPMQPSDIPEFGAPQHVEAPVPAPEHAAELITNQSGLSIPLGEPHIYADKAGEHLFVYGGLPADRANLIADYLAKNPDSTVFATDDDGKYRIPWHLVDGKPMPGEPVRTPGLFGFLSSWMNPPAPEEFEKLVR